MKPMCVNCKRREVFSISGKESSVKLCMQCTDLLLTNDFTLGWWMGVVRQYENK